MKNPILFLMILGLAQPAWAQSLDEQPPSLGLLDIILLGLAMYFLWRLITRLMGKGQDQQGPPTYDVNSQDQDGQPQADENRQARARAAWDYLTGEADKQAQTLEQSAGPANSDQPDFERDEFIRGAKAMYARVRQAWARRDLEDLSQFATTGMLEELELQARRQPDPEEVFIIRVRAQVRDMRHENGQTVVEVLYQASVSYPAHREPKQEQEVWTFTKDDQQPDSHWLLSGMEKTQ